MLARLPNGAARNRIVSRVLQGRARVAPRPSPVLAPLLAEREEESLSLVEDAAALGEVLVFRYYSASRGQMESRAASPHKVSVGPPARFMATCHKSGTLKWFRVDRILSLYGDNRITLVWRCGCSRPVRFVAERRRSCHATE